MAISRHGQSAYSTTSTRASCAHADGGEQAAASVDGDATSLVVDPGCDHRAGAGRDRDCDHEAGLTDRIFPSIVVGTDGSPTAEMALRAAIDLARQSGAALNIVSAYEPGPGSPSGQAADGDGSRSTDGDAVTDAGGDAAVESLLDHAGTLAGEAGLAQVATFARAGDAAEAILEVAEQQNADLIVIGNKGLTGAQRLLLGSVPNKVSHRAPCSVLIVRTT
jgi:nucleotide-binding universal stress UspA family protein